MVLLLLMAVVPALAFAATSGPAPIPNPPSFQISTNILTLCKGVVNYIPVTVSNLGKFNGSITMESLQLGLSGGKSLVPVANGSTTSLTVKPNTSVTTVIPVFVNLNSTELISASVSVNYNYLNYYSDSEIRNISFGAGLCPSQLSVSVVPKVLTAGKISNVTFNLTNLGSNYLSDISLKTSLPNNDGQVLTDQPVSLGSISPHGSKSVTENLFIDGNASETFPMNFSISLYNGSSFEQLAPSIAVLASGIINMTATGTTLSPTEPATGGIFSISFILTDLGTVGASAVTATVMPPPGLLVFGSNSVFIGNMQVDSQTPVTLTLSASSKAGNYTVPIRISYLNNLRQEQNVTIKVPVSVGGGVLSANAISSSGGKAVTYTRKGGGAGLIIIVVLSIAVVVLGVLFYKERKRNRKEAKR